MLLSHELGEELTAADVERRVKEIRKYLRDNENAKADIEYSLSYWRELLEKKYEEKYGKK